MTSQTDHVIALSMRNDSNIKRMLWIGLYTFLLNIITLTLFRFWGRTHFRRQLWSDTTIDGEALEYTGRGKELFYGFLIAIFTVMLPTLLVLLAAQLFLGEAGAFVAILFVYLFFFWLIGVALFLVRRYLMSRTRYRGIRLEQRGKAIDYGWRSFGYTLLNGVTLGWFSPEARIRLSRYMWSQAYFGSEPIKFDDTDEAKAEPVYRSFALLWVGAVLLYVGFAVIVNVTGLSEAVLYGDLQAVGLFYLIGAVIGVLIAFFAAWHQTVMTRRIVKSLSVGGVTATCGLTTWQLLKVWLLGSILTLLTLGIGALAFDMMVWRVIANNLRFEGEIDFSAIEQASTTGPAQGEGIADGLDIGAGF